MHKPTLAISIGDINGVGLELAIKTHQEISQICKPLYCVDKEILQSASQLLSLPLSDDMILSPLGFSPKIKVGQIDKESGEYSYKSFKRAIDLCEKNEADALVTMPIHKEAWMLGGLEYKGHTDLLRKHFKQDAIMMLGCDRMYVALYTEHIPLKDVASTITKDRLIKFFRDFYKSIGDHKVAVLGLNPHAGDNGVLGDEERAIEEAILEVNKEIGRDLFDGAIVPDIAFTPHFRKNYRYFIAMYHDQGLAPLKALYFDESVNISLNLPIIRTSVDHGTAFDIAYQGKAKNLSYINAVKSAISLLR